MKKDGTMDDFGIPASIVAKYLDEHGIVVEKTGPYNLLFLFSIGIDKTKALEPAACADRLQTRVRPEPAGEKHAAVAVP